MEQLIVIPILLLSEIVPALSQDFGYSYSYSCWRDCGYYKTQEFSYCKKYQNDNCWVPSRRSIVIAVFILSIILITALLVCFCRRCSNKQRKIKMRPNSPPPGSMCIFEA